ncbi:MAG: hypothetical protein A2857_02905 [Candidatus Levybacteria bacterium RIFCSPHIGHO2_01_FULL_36_15]|nr:MAG: hypothetical protein A2857_02905 [Candidatus Levybacteria bacterium RIFCSPHIGHO2_01_FULL_36_15]OGH38373.1 MAG: hypothetical protein A2905_06420 [Candidatus Levybacteria bacterium RIFCSPLOWO2_01_FULL_36_10]
MADKQNDKLILAIVGMPGSGKSEVAEYLQNKNIPFVRFGDLNDEELKRQGLDWTPENTAKIRLEMREKHGMDVYAVRSKPKIEKLLQMNNIIAIDGLYSWEEYKFLKEEFKNLFLIHVYAEPPIRYERLVQRSSRKFSCAEARTRDISEIEKINKGGPIAIADYLVENNSNDFDKLHDSINLLLERLKDKKYER